MGGEKIEKGTLDLDLSRLMPLQFLSCIGMPLQAGRALNMRPIHCSVDQITDTLLRHDARGGYRVSKMMILI